MSSVAWYYDVCVSGVWLPSSVFRLIIVGQVIKTEVNQFFDNHIAKECLYFMGLTNAANHIWTIAC